MKNTKSRRKTSSLIALTGILSTFLFLGVPLDTLAAPIQGVITDKHFVSGQTSSYYNDGKYTGLLNAEYYEAEPQKTKNASMSVAGTSVHTASCIPTHDGGATQWGNKTQGNSDAGQTQSYSDAEGYSGTLNRGSTSLVGIDRQGHGSCGKKGDSGSLYDVHNYSTSFSGIVTKPAVWRWRGTVEAKVTDPTNDQGMPGATTGGTSGSTYWELQRNDTTKPSDAFATMSYAITGTHYATRNPYHQMNYGGESVRQVSGITRTKPASAVKGGQLGYAFGYEYTNHFTDIYNCVDTRNGGCYAWNEKIQL